MKKKKVKKISVPTREEILENLRQDPVISYAMSKGCTILNLEQLDENLFDLQIFKDGDENDDE